eukprot:scaffold9584_cov72-Skeletonema_dohrnii-CCMP3373.AAC.1
MVSGERIQRLFLERSTEALPMGSKIRNSVGSNFDKALHLLQLEIEKRMKDNERPAASTSNKLLKKKGSKASHKYALMAFSDSCHNFSPTDKRLKLCSDYASSTDFLQEKKDVLQTYKHALLYNRHDNASFVDHCAFISSFIEQLQDDASDVTTLKDTERSIRDFVSSLVVRKSQQELH